MHALKKKKKTTTTALVWQTNLSSMIVATIFFQKQSMILGKVLLPTTFDERSTTLLSQ